VDDRTPSDAELVQRILAGDVERFAVLIARYREPSARLALRMLGGDQDEVEDVLQDSFVRAYRALGSCEDPARFGAWLYRIVFSNRCGVQRSLYWCADNPGTTVPEPVACPRVARTSEAPAEPRHFVLHRKEFQWHLPPGTRIRYRDCPAQEFPTYGMGCTSASGSTARR